MHAYPLLELLAVGFVLALFFGYLARWIGLSPIVGYLLAGFLAGPNFSYLPFVANPEYAGQMAEAGVILLMFGVGLHFKLDDLKAVRGVAVPGALIQIAVATAAATLAARAWGLSLGAGLTLGLGLSVASTVVLLRVLEDNDALQTAPGHVAVGWLIVEDIFTVLVLVLLPTLASAAGPVSGRVLAAAAALAVLKLALMWAIILTVGGRLAPWFLTKVARTRSSELFTLTVLVIAFATAVGAAEAFGASMALGAFLGGLVVGKSSLSHQAGANLLPLKDAFSVLFFVSVGLLFDPGFLVENPGLVLSALALALLLKPLTAMGTVILLGYSVRTGLTVGAGLAQVGEFSFILANVAHGLGLIPQTVVSLLVVVCLVSISLNPSLVKAVPRMEAALRRSPRLWRLLNRRSERRASRRNRSAALELNAAEGAAGRALVVGYGPTGRKVASALRAGALEPVIIDLNVDTVAELTAEGRLAIFGDASEPDVLRAAGVGQARYLVVTIPDISQALATVARAKDMNPGLRALVRARFLKDQSLLENLGVAAVAFEEAEVAETLARLALSDVRASQKEPPG